MVVRLNQQVNFATGFHPSKVKSEFYSSFVNEGVPPNCKCEDKYVFDEIHWYCRPWYLETTTEHIIRNYTTPVYKPSCGAFQDGIYPNCHWR